MTEGLIEFVVADTARGHNVLRCVLSYGGIGIMSIGGADRRERSDFAGVETLSVCRHEALSAAIVYT